MAKVTDAPTQCPKCNGTAFYDNRADKRSPKAPDWKCKNKDCGEGFWLDKPKDAPATNTATATQRPTRAPQTWGNLMRVYQRCASIALKTWPKADHQALVASTATLFIQANQAGLQVDTAGAKPAPKPEPPPKPEPKAMAASRAADFADFPEALELDEEDGLPF